MKISYYIIVHILPPQIHCIKILEVALCSNGFNSRSYIEGIIYRGLGKGLGNSCTIPVLKVKGSGEV